MIPSDLCDQQQPAVTACLHRFAAIDEKSKTDDLMARITTNDQCVRHRVLTQYAPNAGITNMKTQCDTPQLASNVVGFALASAI